MGAGVRRQKSASWALPAWGGAGPPYQPREAPHRVTRRVHFLGSVVGTKVLGSWCIHLLRPAAKWGRSRWPCPGDGILGHLAAGSIVPNGRGGLAALKLRGPTAWEFMQAPQ